MAARKTMDYGKGMDGGAVWADWWEETARKLSECLPKSLSPGRGPERSTPRPGVSDE